MWTGKESHIRETDRRTIVARQLDAQELRRRLITFEGLSEDELASVSREAYPLACKVKSQASLRRAVDALVSFCVLDHYEDREAVDLMMRVSRKAKYEHGIPDAYKALAFQALERGEYAEAMDLLETAAWEGAGIGSRPDPVSRACFAYWHDPATDRAYETIGRHVAGPTLKQTTGRHPKFAIVTSSLMIHASTTSALETLVNLLRERDLAVVVISTECGPSNQSPAIARMQGQGAEVFLPSDPTASRMQRLQQVVQYLDRDPVDVAICYTWPLDSVAKVASVIRLAPRQVFINNTCEQTCGEFDLVLYSTSVKELAAGVMGGERRFIGPTIAALERIETAEPFKRSDFGLDDENVILGTYGRTAKCCDFDYVRTLARILRSAPQARLIIAGYGDPQSDPLIRELFACEEVMDQVLFPGNFPGAYHGIYKMTDVYCDTLFWRGGQSILEAMAAAVPVVAIRALPDPVLDPTGVGCMSNSADLLGPHVPVAAPGDYDAYVRIALQYIHDPQARRTAGSLLRSQAGEYDAGRTFERLVTALEECHLLW